MPDENNGETVKTRQQRREERLLKRRGKMQHHGRKLAQIYRNAILKRLRKPAKDKPKE